MKKQAEETTVLAVVENRRFKAELEVLYLGYIIIYLNNKIL